MAPQFFMMFFMSNNNYYFKKFFISSYQTPTEILNLNICAHFQELISRLSKDLRCPELKTTIACEISGKIKPPKVIIKNNEILLHKKFIDYLWAYTYGWFVLYDEFMMKSSLKYSSNKKIVDRAQGLRRRAEKKDLYIWFNSMPRPDGLRLSKKEKNYAYIANAIFLDALSVWLFHEVGHVKFRHFKGEGERDEVDQIQCEQDCDNYAIKAFVGEETNQDILRNKMIGVVIAFSSMFFLDDKKPLILVQKKHPDLDTRFANILETFSSEYSLADATLFHGYFIADCVIRRFYHSYKRYYEGMGIKFRNLSVETSKELFEEDVKLLKPVFQYLYRKKMIALTGFISKEYDGMSSYYSIVLNNKLPLTEKKELCVFYYDKFYKVYADISVPGDGYYSYKANQLISTIKFFCDNKVQENIGLVLKKEDCFFSDDMIVSKEMLPIKKMQAPYVLYSKGLYKIGPLEFDMGDVFFCYKSIPLPYSSVCIFPDVAKQRPCYVLKKEDGLWMFYFLQKILLKDNEDVYALHEGRTYKIYGKDPIEGDDFFCYCSEEMNEHDLPQEIYSVFCHLGNNK